MQRDLTAQQVANTQATFTKPVQLICIAHAGYDELLSLSGAVVYGAQAYAPGEVEKVTLSNSQSATIVMRATPERITQVEQGSWRNGACKIYTVPALPGDDDIYTTPEGILLLDGKIKTSSFTGGKIVVQAIHKHATGRLSPRLTFDEATTPPQAGTVISDGTTTYILEARR